jgi:DNA-binding CsgD family transcriptional regulator
MPTRSRSEFQAILRLGYEAATASSLAEFRERCAAGVVTVVSADVVTYNEIDCAHGVVEVISRPDNWLLPSTRADFDRLYAQHPLINHYATTNDGRAHKISDFLDQDAFHSLELYRTVFEPNGLEYQIAITLPGPPTRVIGLALNRRRPDFSEHERALLNLLRPHLALAYHLVQERASLRDRLAAIDRGLAAVTEGLILLTPQHEIDYASPKAIEFLGPHAGSRLPGPLKSWLERGPDQPLALDGLTFRFVSDAGLGVLVLSRAASHPGVTLTPREMEVLASVADGFTDRQVAERLKLSERTVQRHVANIFEKLDVHTRTAAVRRVFG